MSVRVRFAPSPTGFLHIGGLRMALFDYLIAKRYGGKLIFRLEDTDQSRLVPGATEQLTKVFHDLNIDFDESPTVGGEFGPYVQSERREIYHKYIGELLKTENAYYCFCSADRLTKLREEQTANKLPPRYDRCCRDLSAEVVREKLASNENFVIRQVR
jgi:glutamyl/glutaminyl-tRNA synthetase